MSNLLRYHLVRLSICLLILLIADITVSFAKTDPQLRQRVWKRIEKVLNRYQGYSFNRTIKIGDPAKFRAALKSADIEISMAKLMQCFDKGVNEPDDEEVLCSEDTVGNVVG